MVEFIVHKLVHEGVRMVNNLRSPEIIKLANQRSILRVEELAKYFNVSVQTIRKDLNKGAIYIGGQLQLFFGITGRRWALEKKFKERMDFNIDPANSVLS